MIAGLMCHCVRLIRDTEEDSDDSWVNVSLCPIVSGTGSPGLSCIKGP